MSGTIDTYINTSVTLGSVSYPTPLTITANGTVAPGDPRAAAIYVPGALTGLIVNDGQLLGSSYLFANGGDGIDLAAAGTLTLNGAGLVQGGMGGTYYYGPPGARGVLGGIGSSLAAGAALINNGNTILGGSGGAASVGGYDPGSGFYGTYGVAGGGGGGAVFDTGAQGQNTGQIIGGTGGDGAYAGGQGGIGVVLREAASFGNQGTVAGGNGGTGQTISGGGGEGVRLYDGSSLSNSGLILGGDAVNYGTGVIWGGTGLNFWSGGSASNAVGGTIAGGAGGKDYNTLFAGFDATGGAGVAISALFTIGGDGHVTATSTLATFINDGLVMGGTGGTYGVYGGQGGEGMFLAGPASVDNNGVIRGGTGAAAGYYGGSGGTGMLQLAGSSFTNDGLITGGTGSSGLHYGGSGGDGLELGGSIVSTTNEGTIAGGDGATGPWVSGWGGRGADVYLGELTNDGLITGGNGANITFPGIDAGLGGNGAYIGAGGKIINHGTIAGGAGGTGGLYPGAGGVGAFLVAGTLFTDGTMIGGTGTVQADAVTFSTLGGELIVGAGAVFTGLVAGSSGTSDTLALGGTMAGTLAGIGTEFLSFDTLDFLAGVDWTAEGNEAGLAGGIVIGGFSMGDAIILDGFTASSQTYVSGTGLELSDGTSSVTLDIEGAFSTSNFLVTDVGAGTEIQLLCFLQGTRILTPTGERAVESLAIGDAVMTRFAGIQRIKWIGRQSHAAALAPADAGKRPVCIRAGALGEGQPARDLYVSPGHSMLVGGNLLIAQLLVNGVTVTQDWCPEMVEYYQIELETHDCVVAEGAFAETYADCGTMRAQFGNVESFYALYPGYRPPEEVSLCAPRPEKGTALEAALGPVLERAAAVPGALEGWLDLVALPWTVEGWARDAANPALPVRLEFLLDGACLGTALACHYRADLAAAGYGAGRHGFRWTAPCDLPADALARLHVRRVSDGAALPNSAPAPAVQPRLRIVA